MYDPKFDVKKPRPGDSSLAAAIRKGIEAAKAKGAGNGSRR